MSARRTFLLAVCVAVGAGAAAADLPADVFAPAPPPGRLPADVFAAAPDDERVDLVLFGKRRAAFVRVRVRIEGRGYRTAWGDFVLRLYAYLDRDGDGTLTLSEFNRATWTSLLQGPFEGNQLVRPGSRPGPVDVNPADGKVSFDELAGYLRAAQNHGALSSLSGPPPDPRTQAIFGHLDLDGDRVLDAAEMAGAERCVGRLDRDEDEVVGFDEMTPDRSPFADNFRPQTPNVPLDPATSPAALLTDGDRGRVAARLLSLYARSSRGLGPETLGASPSAFRAADADGDGALDHDELARYLAAPTPGLEWSVTFDAPVGRGPGRIGALAPWPGAGLAIRTPGRDSVVAEFEGSEVEFRADDTPANSPGDFFKNQFNAADGDKNGVIDRKEARGNFFLNKIFPVADRDGDGKMTAPEMEAYFERNRDATESQTVLTVSDLGTTLLDAIDVDHDNRLSVRELRGARDRLRKYDGDRDGRVTRAELPRRWQLNVGRGAGNVNRVGNRNARPARSEPSVAKPAWFAGMDRNRDGDVSPREFLGGPEHFRSFDADGDGLIDAREATRTP